MIVIAYCTLHADARSVLHTQYIFRLKVTRVGSSCLLDCVLCSVLRSCYYGRGKRYQRGTKLESKINDRSFASKPNVGK